MPTFEERRKKEIAEFKRFSNNMRKTIDKQIPPATEELRGREIEEFKIFSNKITRDLVAQFPSQGVQIPTFATGDYRPPVFQTKIFGDFQRNHPNKPSAIYFNEILRKWQLRGIGATARGKYQFIVLTGDVADRVLAGTHGHEHLAKDQDVEFAGEVFFKGGELLFWTNRSGHYTPHPMLSTRVGFPWQRFVQEHERPLWLLEEAEKITNNLATIALWLGWHIDEVENLSSKGSLKRLHKRQQQAAAVNVQPN